MTFASDQQRKWYFANNGGGSGGGGIPSFTQPASSADMDKEDRKAADMAQLMGHTPDQIATSVAAADDFERGYMDMWSEQSK